MIELKWLQKFYDDVFWLTFIQAFKCPSTKKEGKSKDKFFEKVGIIQSKR